jgi:hypothetical protein
MRSGKLSLNLSTTMMSELAMRKPPSYAGHEIGASDKIAPPFGRIGRYRPVLERFAPALISHRCLNSSLRNCSRRTHRRGRDRQTGIHLDSGWA